MLSIIAAMGENNVIGRGNNLIWNLPDDLHRFKEITSHKSKTLIMGRKTFESLPGILPGRKHIILSKNTEYSCPGGEISVVHDIKDLKPFIDSQDEYFVIGGGKIFSLLLPHTSRMYLTIVHESFNGDTYFPGFDKGKWKVVKVDEHSADTENPYDTTFLVLEKL